MKTKHVVAEMLIITSVIALVWLGMFYITQSKEIMHISFDGGHQNVAFALNWKAVVLLPCLIVLSFVYLVKEAFYRYQRWHQNILGLCINTVLTVLLTSIPLNIFWFIDERNPGWVIYPPLSALPNSDYINPIIYLESVVLGLRIAQACVILMVVVSAVLTGKSWPSRKSAAVM